MVGDPTSEHGTPSRSPRRKQALAAAGTALFVAAVVLALLPRDAGRPGSTTANAPAGSHEQRPGLVPGRPRSESETVPAGPQPAAGAPEPTVGSAPKLAEIAVRMERARPDGRTEGVEVSVVPTEDVEISVVYVRGRTFTGSALKDGSIKVAPGWIVNVITSDPRVPVPTFRLKVPDPVPRELVFRVPSLDDLATQTVSLEVVDSVTGEPLADAVFEFEDLTVVPLHADREGRIRIDPVKELYGRPASGLVRWLVESGTIHAPGHRSFVPRTYLWRGRPQAAAGGPGVDLSDLDAVRRNPVVRVPLRPIPQGASERRLRLRYADGGSTEGLLVAIQPAFPCAVDSTIATDGIRRLGPSGEIAFPMETVVGLDVWKDGLPMVSLHLHADRWPPSGARELRLPPIAEVEVEITEAPDGKEGYWSDADASRSNLDGPFHPVESDPEAPAHLQARSLCVGTGLVAVEGSLAPKHGTVRFSLPVGSKRTLSLTYEDEHRRLDLAPERPGPLRIRTRWVDLPKR